MSILIAFGLVVAAGSSAGSTADELTEAQVAMLIMGSSHRILENTLLPESEQLKWLSEIGQMPRLETDPRIARVSRLFLLSELLQRRSASNARATQLEMKKLGDEVLGVALDGVLRGVTGAPLGTFDDFRRGPGHAVEAWLFEARRREIANRLADAEVFAANTQLASSVEAWSEARSGSPSPSLSVRIKPLRSVRGDQIRSKGRSWTQGLVGTWGAEVKYTGRDPLTNVCVVVCVTTKGRDVGLKKEQLNILGVNEFTGFGNHNDDVALLMMTDNLISTMPIAGYGFFERVERNGRMRVLLPESVAQDAYAGMRVRLYSDQGCSQLFAVDGRDRPRTVQGGDTRATGPVAATAFSDGGSVEPDLEEWFPKGTVLQCRRTWGSGSHVVSGTVIENDGGRLVFEVASRSKATPRLWHFEWSSDGLELRKQVKKNPRKAGGVVRNCESNLRVTENGITGNYSWDLLQPQGRAAKRVTGSLDWTVIERPD